MKITNAKTTGTVNKNEFDILKNKKHKAILPMCFC